MLKLKRYSGQGLFVGDIHVVFAIREFPDREHPGNFGIVANVNGWIHNIEHGGSILIGSQELRCWITGVVIKIQVYGPPETVVWREESPSVRRSGVGRNLEVRRRNESARSS